MTDLQFSLEAAGHPLADENLAGLCFVAQPGSKVRRGANSGVLLTAFQPNGAERYETPRNPNAEAQIVPKTFPPICQCDHLLLHFESHLQRPGGMIRIL